MKHQTTNSEKSISLKMLKKPSEDDFENLIDLNISPYDHKEIKFNNQILK